MASKREDYIDVAKAIGIILVVLGHTEFKYSQVIYQFHLPLFFFLSGAVMNPDKTNDLKSFIIKKIKALYIPFITFELLFFVLHNWFAYIGFYSDLSGTTISYSMRTFFIMLIKILTLGGGEQLAGPLWFLISTLEISIIFAILIRIRKYVDKYFLFLIFSLCILLYFVGCYSNLPRMLSQSLIGMFFYCCGFIYRNFKNRIKWSWISAVISMVIIIICAKYNYVDISQLDITVKYMLILSGLSGCYLTIYISKIIMKFKIRFFTYCGRNSIYVLALHCFSFKLIMLVEILIYHEKWNLLGRFPVYQYNEPWCIVLTIFGVGIPLLIKYLLEKMKEWER